VAGGRKGGSAHPGADTEGQVSTGGAPESGIIAVLLPTHNKIRGIAKQAHALFKQQNNLDIISSSFGVPGAGDPLERAASLAGPVHYT